MVYVRASNGSVTNLHSLKRLGEWMVPKAWPEWKGYTWCFRNCRWSMSHPELTQGRAKRTNTLSQSSDRQLDWGYSLHSPWPQRKVEQGLGSWTSFRERRRDTHRPCSFHTHYVSGTVLRIPQGWTVSKHSCEIVSSRGSVMWKTKAGLKGVEAKE